MHLLFNRCSLLYLTVQCAWEYLLYWNIPFQMQLVFSQTFMSALSATLYPIFWTTGSWEGHFCHYNEAKTWLNEEICQKTYLTITDNTTPIKGLNAHYLKASKTACLLYGSSITVQNISVQIMCSKLEPPAFLPQSTNSLLLITQTLTKLSEQGHHIGGTGPRPCTSLGTTTGHLTNLSALLSSSELAFGPILPADNAMFSACR